MPEPLGGVATWGGGQVGVGGGGRFLSRELDWGVGVKCWGTVYNLQNVKYEMSVNERRASESDIISICS